LIARWDRAVVEAFQHAHWGPANWVFVQLSHWWVHSVLIVGIGLVADIRRRTLPLATALATLSYLAADGLDYVLKRAFERPRPPVVDPAVHPLVAVPHSYSMPSGHAMTAFASALAVGLVHPRLRLPLLVLAGLIAISRVWLGVHYLSDVIVGAAFGSALSLTLWLVARGIIGARTSSP
jgi:undecaprenyl-diphosphatase